MNLYSIYGSCLGTTLEFPELRRVNGAEPKWTFQSTPQLEPAESPVELGAERIYADVHARLYRHAAGHRITVDDTGDFDIATGQRRLRWQERADAWPDFVRAHLMGRVLATSLFLDGWLPMHGSGVAFASGAVAFLAPKGFGKSSLALALVALGARLLTDDTLPVELTPEPLAWPGVHSVRAHADSLAATGVAGSGLETREGKVMVTDLSLDRLASVATPLRALYLIHPVTPESATSAAERISLPGMRGALALVAHVKIAGMLGGAAASTLLDRASVLARAVPVYSLQVPRDFAQLNATAAAIASWHE